MIKAKIVGAGGYGGVGITELLLKHPETEIGCLVSLSDTGRKMSDVFPHLRGFCDDVIVSPENPKTKEDYDVVFYSTPDGVGMQTAADELERGAKVIDYSGDFRFGTTEQYAEYANFIGLDPMHKAPALLTETVYGLPELHEIDANQMLVGNPGCFAVSCILGLAPAVNAGIIDTKSIICDCKTGVSGAGKKPSAAFHYPNRYDNMNAYKLAGHQHVVEVEQELSALSDEDVQITFTSQVVPVCRGIMSTLYASLDGQTADDVLEIYREFNQNNLFVRVQDAQTPASIADVRGTNYCVLTVDVDARNNRLRIVSHIDNLMKGQAGNAMQNMNLMFGMDAGTGLAFPGQYP
ncbi:N-acetyl-gamma-glutamyl-phosphate reductase [Pontiella sulfatireligans]|uniref:N-acetyl-gamma-glutamyl-phosphate reductase n=1 Tax=Pontiella sulfatireligans TaxID=2750658 RepID=A0A6C2UM46_9BACT|nr:N-acetyl-gamma-glutamyl-phosphate reductase [Pontiella sulfatireligans]VGO20186.1 N-acetyl-gamma-glutamyl-phosphate reductase [Pontiella sulfatireligans]